MSRLSGMSRRDLERLVNEIRSRHSERMDIGTAGSGNWGHQGRKGLRGGSAPGGGVHNRREIPHSNGTYTSWSKQKKAVAKTHKTTEQELANLPEGSVVICKDKTMTMKKGAFYYKDASGTLWAKTPSKVAGVEAKIAINDLTNPNIDKSIADFGGYRERMEKAPRYESRQTVDDILRSVSGKVWKTLDDDSKRALQKYTGTGFGPVNSALRDGTGDKNDPTVKALTDAINQSEMPQDMWLQRGSGKGTVAKLLGVQEELLDKVISGDIPAATLVGLKGRDKGFLSTGSTSGQGFSYKEVQMHIFAPKGTKGMYVEPFSTNGFGDKNWDGESKQNFFGNEFETILQRGTAMQTTRAWVEGDKLHIECFVTDQDTEA